MGEKNVIDAEGEAGEIRAFSKRLLRDLRALERMLKEERFEKGVRRIGAEQEVFIVDRHMRPAPSIGVAGELSRALAIRKPGAARFTAHPPARQCVPTSNRPNDSNRASPKVRHVGK